MNYYNSYNNYLRQAFGCRVHRLSLNAGFDCPNLDGTLSRDGCIFCDNKAFSHFAGKPGTPLKEQISSSMEHAKKRFKAEKFIAFFQAFSSTYAPADKLKETYSIIEGYPDIVGLAVSTRPDCLDAEKIAVLKSFAPKREVYLELGLQSIHDKTLQLINRNHSYGDFLKALDLAVSAGIKTAAHVIFGLPGEDKTAMLETARALAKLPLWGIKFHCLHVVKNTRLEKMYNSGKAKLLSETEYIDILIDFLELMPKDRVILRLVSDADKDLLVAPEWINEKQRLIAEIEKEMIKRKTYQGKAA
jgi:radical SAM protein (TIGR01212 family)